MRTRTMNAPETTPEHTVLAAAAARLLSAVFRPRQATAAGYTAHELILRGAWRLSRIPLNEIESVECVRGRVWGAVRFQSASHTAKLSWLQREDAESFVDALNNVLAWRGTLRANSETLRSLRDRFEQLSGGSSYIRHGVFDRLRREAEHVSGLFSGDCPEVLSSLPERRNLAGIQSILKDHEAHRGMLNEQYIAKALDRSKEFFDTAFEHPLTQEQREAVVVDEDRNLLIAAAGSGKTSVLAAKAAWLLGTRDLNPSDLLLLAFSREAQNEMGKRVRACLGEDRADGIQVSTFHGLGRRIIEGVEGAPPALDGTATNNSEFRAQLKSIVRDLARTDPRYAGHLRQWFQSRSAPYRALRDCQSLGEYWDHLRRHRVETLRGDRVRSFAECEIGNFLTLNNVSHQYRSDYEPAVGTPEGRKYRPSFHLPDAHVYIDVIPRRPIRSGYGWDGHPGSVRWNRDADADRGTIPIEVEAPRDEALGPTVFQDLSDQLRERGVVLAPILDSDLFDVLEGHVQMDRLIQLLAGFLRHFKGSRLSHAEVERRAAEAKDSGRANLFSALFHRVFQRYGETLGRSTTIDFDDMINLATRYVDEGRTSISFAHILIDEFQDISPARARLVKALLARTPASQLFAVGDDWQAIFRFAGSDIAIMRNFASHFGHTEQRYLGDTFRCSESITRVATQFILKNAAQIPKEVRSFRPADGPGVHISFPVFRDGTRDTGSAADARERDFNDPRPGGDSPTLQTVLKAIGADASRHGGTAGVLLLGRYRSMLPDEKELAGLKRKHPGLRLSARTIHAAKGLGAQYVVVLGLGSGKYSFPSEIVDDPLLDLVLPEPEQYPNAEERRLMYVALTRAERLVFLLADGGFPSPFVLELIDEDYHVEVLGQPPEPDARCLACGEGRLQRRRAASGYFYGCSHWSYCEHTQPPCPKCAKNLPAKAGDGSYLCACGARHHPCGSCSSGWLLTKRGRYGDFLGCSNWPVCDFEGRSLREPR